MKNETLPVDVARRLDEICDRFESQWSNDPHHLIERLLRDAPAELRPLFFEALLELELELRHRRGDAGNRAQRLYRQGPGDVHGRCLQDDRGQRPGGRGPGLHRRASVGS